MSHTAIARARKLEVDFSLAKTERRKNPVVVLHAHIIMDRVSRLNLVLLWFLFRRSVQFIVSNEV